MIEANWGDWIEVDVYNNMTDLASTQGVTVHWHGLV